MLVHRFDFSSRRDEPTQMDPLETDEALAFLSQYWWLMAFRGLIIFVYGVLVFAWQEMTTLAFFGSVLAYVFAGGIFSLVLMLRAQKTKLTTRTWILTGIATILVISVAIVLPGLSALLLVGLIGVWSLVVGSVELILAARLLKVAQRWTLFLAGGLTCGTGLIILAMPLYLFVFDVAWLGVPAILVGCILVVLAFRMRRIAEGAPSIPTST
jgi:uncharacterized membrane protein HdeD (DUF308 family)